MTENIIIVTECSLTETDIKNLLSLYKKSSHTFSIIQKPKESKNMLLEILDHLMLLDLKEMLHDITKKNKHTNVKEEDVAKSLDDTIKILEKYHLNFTAKTTNLNPLVAIEEEMKLATTEAVVIITQPHAVEDSLHKDWASKAQKKLGIPVLHTYSGTSFIV